MLPHRCKQFVGIGGIHHQVGAAGFFIDKKYSLPRFAAIGCFEYASLRIFTPGGSQGCDVSDIWIYRMQNHAMDFLGFFEPQKFPAIAAINAFINSIPNANAVAGIALAGSDPNDAGIGLKNRYRANRRGGLIVKNRLPGDSAIGGFPDAASRCANINDIRIGNHGFDVANSAAHASGTDAASFHARKKVMIELGKNRVDRENSN